MALRANGGEGSGLLLERERELEAFARALDRLGEGVGSLLLVEGPAGIGKTRLLNEADALARRRRGLLVRTARAGQLEREMPFGVARQLLEPVIEGSPEKERARLLAGSAELALIALGRADPERASAAGDPFAPIHGLYWLVANLADDKPVVLVLDDLHWADTQTLRWLDYLARRLADLAVLVVAAARTGEPDGPPELGPLRLEAGLVHPAPLSPSAIDELIACELQSQPAPEFTEACASATAGSPFLLAEIVRTMRADGIAPDADAARIVAELGPESVATYVLTRLGRFGEDAISLAQAIAVLGEAPQLRRAAQLAGLGEDKARSLCDRLRKAEILTRGVPIEFVHPLVRAAIYSEDPEEERSVAHRQAAEQLSEGGAGADEIAPHLMACAPNGDQWVVAQLGQAALGAVRAGAYDSAQAYLERALAEPPDDDLPLLYGLGRTMIQSDPVRAPEMLADVADRAADTEMRRRALRDSAFANFLTGNWDEAARRYASLLDGLPEDDRDQQLVLESQLYCLKGLMGRNPADSQRIEDAAAGVGTETRGERIVRQALALDRFLSCAPVEEVVELAGVFPSSPHISVIATGTAGKILAWSGRWDDADREISLLKEAARSQGVLIAAGYLYVVLSEIFRLAGRLGDSEAEARTALEVSMGSASLSARWNATVNLVATLTATGELEEASSVADRHDFSGGLRDGRVVATWPIEVRGRLFLARGEWQAGLDDLLEFGEELERARYLNPAVCPWRQEAAPALAALERTAEGEQLIAVAEERARQFEAAHLIGTVLRSRALLEPRKSQIETLRESVSMLETYGPPHELARSLLELGASLRRDGQRTDSREPLRRALELAHRSGAGGIETRTREELAAVGSRPRSAFRTGVASLTASELRVAKLAAEGLTNVEIAQRLFVSRKTVEKHLGNAYTKLEISSRKQLPQALDETSTV